MTQATMSSKLTTGDFEHAIVKQRTKGFFVTVMYTKIIPVCLYLVQKSSYIS